MAVNATAAVVKRMMTLKQAVLNALQRHSNHPRKQSRWGIGGSSGSDGKHHGRLMSSKRNARDDLGADAAEAVVASAQLARYR